MRVIRTFSLFFLVASLSVIHIFQLGSLWVRPFSKDTFRRLNGKLAAFWWALLVQTLERFCGISLNVTGNNTTENTTKDVNQGKARNALVISNHQSLIDPLVILILARNRATLPYLKWFVKKSLIYVPFLGWGLWFLDCIFLNRKWEQDQSQISESFLRIKSHRDPIWLISFVEGTRKTNQNLVLSQDFASRQGLKPFKNVLFPRYKGFVATIEELGDRIEVIYDLTIQYECPKPSLIRLFKGDLGRVHIHVEEFDLRALSKNRENLKDWLITQFRKKDQSLSTLQKSVPILP